MYPDLPRLSAEDLVERLEHARRVGDGRWMARCPAHGDKGPSLSIREGDDGRVLLRCHAGCEFSAIIAALGVEARQLFPARDPLQPWKPRPPKPDPDRQARALLERLRDLQRPPPPERMRRELRFVGLLLLRGTAGLAEIPTTFRSTSIRTFLLRLIYEGLLEVARDGRPRRWFSPLVIGREIDRRGGPGHARRLGIYGWCRTAIGIARADQVTGKAERHG